MAEFFDNPSLTLALSLAAGIVAQALARHVQIPGIVLLLGAGVLLGPDVAGVIHPALLGKALHILVGFAVAVILFEGGLNLRFGRLRRQQRSIKQLVTLGALVTATGATLAAKAFLRWTWRTSALFGTLVIVTGPTVVTPLLRRLKVQRTVATVLEAEGVLIDAIGAVSSAFVLEIALNPTRPTLIEGLRHLAAPLGLGLVTGTVAGLLLALLLRYRNLVPEGLENIFVLCLVLALYQVSHALVAESGIVAVTVAGLIVGNARTTAHHDLLEFKEQLTVMLIGMLFVLLAADVRLQQVRSLGTGGVLTVVALVLIIRPLSVFAGTWGSALSLRQKLFLGWMGPRGIVAAAIASLFAAELDVHGVSGGSQLRAMVFLVIAATVTLSGLTGGPVARLLQLRQQSRGWVVLGAHELARAFVQAMSRQGEEVTCIDTNLEACVGADREGIRVIQGNALQERTLGKAAVASRIGAIGLSPNEEINLLFLQKVRQEAKLKRLYMAVQDTHTVTPEMVKAAGAETLFGRPEDIELWAVRLRRGLALTETFHLKRRESRETPTGAIGASRSLYLPLTLQRGAQITPVSDATRYRANDSVTFLLHSEHADAARTALASLGWQLKEPRAATVPAA